MVESVHVERSHTNGFYFKRLQCTIQYIYNVQLPFVADCGIGHTAADNTADSVVSPHRALVFCQIKAMLDIVENDLLK